MGPGHTWRLSVQCQIPTAELQPATSSVCPGRQSARDGCPPGTARPPETVDALLEPVGGPVVAVLDLDSQFDEFLAEVVGPRFAPPSIPGMAVTGVALLLALASLRSGVIAYLRTTNVEYVLTNRNLYRKSGVWSTNVTRVAVANVQNVTLTKDFWGDRFDYGTVAVSTAGSEGTDIAFSDLRSPETAREELQRLMNEARDRSREADLQMGVLDAGTVTQVREDFRGIRDAAERLETVVTAE